MPATRRWSSGFTPAGSPARAVTRAAEWPSTAADGPGSWTTAAAAAVEYSTLQGYTGPDAEAAATDLEVVKLPEAKRGFVLLPRRWVVERPFGWAAGCRRLAKDYERLTVTPEGMHYVAFSSLMLRKAAPQFYWSS